MRRADAPGTGTGDTTRVADRRAVERWFVARGVPQLVEGYSDEQRMDARATPLIFGWLVVASILWVTRPDWPVAWNAAAVALSVAYMGVAYVLVSRLRGRRAMQRPHTWDLLDILTFGLLPALPVAVAHGPPEGALAVGRILLGVLAIYVLIGFGLLEIFWSSVRRIGTELEHIVALVSRTLPTLLILVIFLLFAAEIWEAARNLHAGELALLLGLLALVAALLVLTTVRGELQRIEARADWDAIVRQASATPAAALVPRADPLEHARPLSWLERTNLALVILVNQIAQAAFLAIVVAAFLVAFGMIALPGSVQESWTGAGVRTMATVELAGETRTLSAELLSIAAVLGGIVGLYFTGLALTDPSYRAQYFARVIDEVEQIASVRTIYRAVPAGAARTPARGAVTVTE